MNHKATKTRRTERENNGAAVFLLSSCLCVFAVFRSVPAGAADAPESKAVVIQRYYDQAFGYYKSGDYGRAIQTWHDILRLDPEQKTADAMIREVQKNIVKENKQRLASVYANIARGRYRSALSGLETLLEDGVRSGTTLQSRLEEVVQILPQIPAQTKAWKMTTLAMNAALGSDENFKRAYDGLRYARELDPREPRIKRLLEWFLSHHPEFVDTDTITPGMTMVEYKRSLALDHIYGARYHQAIDVLNDLLALEPDDAIALKRLGSAYFSLGLTDKARDAWRRAAARDPKDAQLKKFLQRVSVPPERPASDAAQNE